MKHIATYVATTHCVMTRKSVIFNISVCRKIPISWICVQ